MSSRVRKYLPVLKRIAKLGDKAKRDYVRKCDKDFLYCISECAKNILKGNVPLTASWSVKKTSLRKKRRILQKGGFLTALLSPLIGVLTSLFAE